MTAHIYGWMAVLVALALPGASLAAEKEKKPYPHYWISVSTANQSIPGMTAEMSGLAGMFGGKAAFGPRRDLRLQLESPQVPKDEPRAGHEVPPVQKMGTSLPLVTPKVEKIDYVPERGTYQRPQEMEKPKARMLIYWGCGDTVGKGQPRVIDTAKMSPTEMGKAFAGRTPSHQAPPAPRKGWTYAEWPNKDDSTEIPKDSSLVGKHSVKGNYLPEIDFALDERRDFMPPVEFKSIQAVPSGAMKVEWQKIPAAIGYFASAIGHDPNTGDSIFWSSSELPELGFALQDYLTPGDVSKFIKEKVVMDSSRTSCTVPPVFKDSQGMLQFIAYGEELNLVHPPKPKDPKKPWNPQWSVKVRLKSTASTPLMASADGSERRKRPARGEKQPAKVQDEESGEQQQSEEGSGARGGAMDRLKGFFGF